MLVFLKLIRYVEKISLSIFLFVGKEKIRIFPKFTVLRSIIEEKLYKKQHVKGSMKGHILEIGVLHQIYGFNFIMNLFIIFLGQKFQST